MPARFVIRGVSGSAGQDRVRFRLEGKTCLRAHWNQGPISGVPTSAIHLAADVPRTPWFVELRHEAILGADREVEGDDIGDELVKEAEGPGDSGECQTPSATTTLPSASKGQQQYRAKGVGLPSISHGVIPVAL